MKWVYALSILILWILLLIIYFINLVYLSSTRMFLFSTSTYVPLSLGLLILIFVAYLLGAFTVLLIKSIVKSKPKDIFEDDF